MKYIFLAHRDEIRWMAMSTNERHAFEDACQSVEQDLRRSGHLLAAEGLQDSRTAITVRVVDGELSLTDGPLAETHGQPIQVFFIQARDLNEAIRVAAGMPQARTGPVEVRTINEW